jgi:hypothetical protein
MEATAGCHHGSMLSNLGPPRLITNVSSMKTQSTPAKARRLVLALCLCGMGLLALLVSLLLMFGWLVSEGPQPSTSHKAATALLGVVVLAASVSCFLLARRLLKVSANPSLHSTPR